MKKAGSAVTAMKSMNIEMTIDELRAELRKGARAVLQVRHAERPKMDPDDPTFGDALHLTREGARTARLLGESLAEFAVDVAFAASPLTRTRETAELIAEGMGVKGAPVLTDMKLGNESFYYEDPMRVLRLFKEMEFFNACFTYFKERKLPGLNDIDEATDTCERWLDEHSCGHRLFVVVTHDCYIAAFLNARGVYGPGSRRDWPRFLDGGVTLIYPDGSRRYALVRAGLSHGICGVRPTKGVVFDFGGVMTTTTMPSRVRKVTDEFGIPWRDLEQGFARYRRIMDGGFITIGQMYDLIWADADIALPKDVRAKILEEDYASFMDEYRNLKTLAWMRSLKASGFKIGILTNMPPSMVPRFHRAFADFIEIADAMVTSGDVGMFKPQKRIYDLLQRKIGLEPDELCFIDDVESNCEGARRSGWHAVRFVDNEQVERDFRERFG